MAGMTVSFDGMRRGLLRDYNAVAQAFLEDEKESLRDRIAELRQSVGAFLCLYSDDPEDEMTDLSDLIDEMISVDD